MNADKWIETTLGETLTLQRGMDLPVQDRKYGFVPVVASTGIIGYHDEAPVNAPGVVIGRSGSIGGGQYIKQDFWPLNTTLWVKDFQGNDPRFCYYLLRSMDFSLLNAGSGVPTLNRNHLHTLPVKKPSLAEQKAISQILGALDDKIELNRQVNQTLEAMAQTVFRSWFVDFLPVKAKIAAKENGRDQNLAAMCAISGKNEDELALLPPETHEKLKKTAALFPNAMEESELGEIPKGWEVNQIGTFGKVVCGKTPPTSNALNFGLDVPFIKIPDMHNSAYVVSPSEYLSFLGETSQANKTIPAGSVCVSCIATVGKVIITHEPSQTNQQINSIVPEHLEHTNYLYFQMKSKNALFHDLASGGSATLNMNTSIFSKINILRPSFEIIEEFNRVTSGSFNHILLKQKEAKLLVNCRNTLLPKLLSGELSVAASAPKTKA